jgi:hypothetical protein
MNDVLILRILRLSRPIAFAIIASALILTSTVASADTSLKVLEYYPGSPSVLGRGQSFFLRIGYTSDQPIRVRAQPFSSGERVPAMTDVSPLNDAGTGEALVSLHLTDPRRVDTIVVTGETKTGDVVAQASVSVDLTWTDRPDLTLHSPPQWVFRMSAEQNSRMQWWQSVLGLVMMGSVPAYFVLQFVLLWRVHDRWQRIAAVPLVLMVPVIAITAFGLLERSNLSFIWLIFTAPLALFYLLVVMILRRRKTAFTNVKG